MSETSTSRAVHRPNEGGQLFSERNTRYRYCSGGDETGTGGLGSGTDSTGGGIRW